MFRNVRPKLIQSFSDILGVIFMIYGYCRVSTHKKDKDTGEYVQTTDLQRDALVSAGVSADNIYEDRISGTTANRPGLDELLTKVQAGDEIIIWKLDRLGRSARNLLELAENLKQRGVNIRSLQDGINTGGKLGGFLLTILGAVAQLERENIRDRVTAGIATSLANGGRIGRKKALNSYARKEVVDLFLKGKTVTELSRTFSVGRATIQRTLSNAGVSASSRESM
ncbi:recombinase family protein [Acetobacter estunensis]|uniref:recombinase family protein n=1 Tax=Acetobacter estunensis TaxID=104097 RepID=UPI001C2CD541|nr:recombinase family protein [Acetobacter estunensis]MBV1838455.1 recombinase family protein [Acetobacter estunensis]